MALGLGAQLRQGRAGAVVARLPRRGARAVPGRGSRVGVSASLDLAERALAEVSGAEDALASVTRERSLFLRYARSRPTQSTAVDDLTVELAVLRDGHVGRSATNGTGAEALAACARRAADAAAEAASSGPGPFPG